MTNKELENIANECRKDILEEVYSASSGHIGGSLSCIDILTAIYCNHLKYDKNNPKWEDRDRVVLSKGHASPAIYSILAECGFFDKDILKTFRNKDSILQGHPDMKNVPGIDMSTGSLGQGLSVANGMALAGKLDNREYNVYAILGDGEIEEGQVWEAIMTSAQYNLNKVIAFVDSNGLQIDGRVSDVMNVESIIDKFKAFNWNVISIDGHNFDEINNAIDKAKKSTDMPTAIIAKTVKGKGISFMENNVKWHGKAPNEEEYVKAKLELGGLV